MAHLSFLSLLTFLAVVSHATSSSREASYWNSVLPNTPMPIAISDRLSSDDEMDNTRVGVEPHLFPNRYVPYWSQDDPISNFFFLENDLRPGAKMTLRFTKTAEGAAFLSRQEANSIPFASSKLPEILHHLNIEPDSAEAEAMKRTLRECEEQAEAGQEKECATSLESMVDFSTKILGTNQVKAISTAVNKEDEAPQEYTVLPNGLKEITGEKLVVCHTEAYAYAVFYCHSTSPKSKAFTVKLAGKDGKLVNAVAACHFDTKSLKVKPTDAALKQLKVKPGSAPLCHFLPQGDVVWSLKN